MKLILYFIINCLYLFQIINCKKFRGLLEDELLDYNLDKSVTPFSEVFVLDNLILEQIDDDIIKIGGQLECKKSFDRNTPIQLSVITQSLEQSAWKEQHIKLSMADACKEFLNPDRFWYNITKLWTSDVCPPKQGFKWKIETQNCDPVVDMPDNVSSGQWRAFLLLTQVSPMGKIQFGFGIEIQLITI